MASGTGSLLAALIERAAAPSSPFRVAAVVIDRDCAAREIAGAAGIPVVLCRLGDHPDRDAWDRQLLADVDRFAPDWVVTAGFMKILGPAFPGAHGVADALAYGVKVTGTTVHLVDGGVDTGPILAQATVPVLPDDTVDTLHERIKISERELLPDVVEAVVTRGVVTDGRKAQIS